MLTFEQGEIIEGKLWHSSLPAPGDLDRTRIEVLVHCAHGYEPRIGLHSSVIVIYTAGLEDNGPPKPEEKIIARDAARRVVHELELGRRVNVNCLAGLNRSGWVLGLALRMRGMEARAAIKLLRERRSPAVLCNDWMELDVLRGEL